VRGNCTNKNCTEHIKPLVDEVTLAQIEYINSLYKKLGEDCEIDFDTLSKKEGSKIIDNLLERLEMGERNE
jgi:hypothetical protein